MRGASVFDLRSLQIPIVQAPMAGGPSTPALAAAVAGAGGMGFLAAGYKTAEAVGRDIATLRRLSDAPFGVNIFSGSDDEAPPDVVAAYARRLAGEAEHHGVSVGDPRFDDDAYGAKLGLVMRERVAVVSFTFGCPAAETVAALHDHDIAVWMTVTSPSEAALAQDAGADALVAQGTEAGGHRGYFSDDGEHEEYGLLVLLRLLGAQTALPLVATGGLMDGPGIAAALAAGASAVQLGSALMLTPEAGTSAPHRARLAVPGVTRLTRAFSGRTARGIVNRFMEEHDAEAPAAYPQVHHLTSPLRAAARAAGDAEAINLWAGEGHASAQARPAGELVRALAAEAEAARA
ncbi:MAG TPA: nitronate monooxygenase [Solirubrobacteraceae bacterium]|jgi:nitronate monooxygenase|nr:nitronate monooxygenase [Solirubrobacteraceae bacterium]